MTLPTFVVLGTAKAGTSSLYRYLVQHPQIYMAPQTELNFFAHEGETARQFRGPGDAEALAHYMVGSIEAYRAQFEGVRGERAVGEVSTHDLYDARAPERLKRFAPDAQLIAVLRNPVDRAFSAFKHLLRDGRETTTDFARALALEPQRIEAGWELLWHYAAMGHYGAQVQRYVELFDREQLRFYRYEEYEANTLAVVQDMYHFVGVEGTFVPDTSVRINVSGAVPRSLRLHGFLQQRNAAKSGLRMVLPPAARRWAKWQALQWNAAPPLLEAGTREAVAARFAGDVVALQELLGWDLSSWQAAATRLSELL